MGNTSIIHINAYLASIEDIGETRLVSIAPHIIRTYISYRNYIDLYIKYKYIIYHIEITEPASV